jgi:hypothetical protein
VTLNNDVLRKEQHPKGNNKNNIVCNITTMEGSYTTTGTFTLMDCSKLDFPSKMLKESLIKCYKVNMPPK